MIPREFVGRVERSATRHWIGQAPRRVTPGFRRGPPALHFREDLIP
jgi:hypothetical protein